MTSEVWSARCNPHHPVRVVDFPDRSRFLMLAWRSGLTAPRPTTHRALSSSPSTHYSVHILVRASRVFLAPATSPVSEIGSDGPRDSSCRGRSRISASQKTEPGSHRVRHPPVGVGGHLEPDQLAGLPEASPVDTPPARELGEQLQPAHRPGADGGTRPADGRH